MTKKITLTGIQATGAPHLGNYVGAIKPAIELTEDQNKAIWNALLKGKDYWNVHFFQYFQTNEQYNDFLNSGHIIMSMSGGEGWGLPEFQSVAMGKHSVTLNATGYKGWANSENSALVYPASKEEAYDNKFFVKGASYNQGQVFWFDEEDFIEVLLIKPKYLTLII